MHRGLRWTGALALALGLALAACAHANEPAGNWLTRLWGRTAKKKTEPAPEQEAEAKTTAPLSASMVRQRAQFEWLRRQEICDKLREIALQNGDEELRRKADLLSQRAWDTYVQRTGQGRGILSPDEQILESKLGMEAVQRTRPAGSGAAAARKSNENRAAARED